MTYSDERAWTRLERALNAAIFLGALDKDWQEGEHPRSKNGQFGEGGSPGSPKPAVAAHHKDAIKHYTGQGFKQVNGHLVGNTPANEQTKATIAGLDDLFHSARLPAPATVYRGAASLAVKNILEQAGGKLRKGQILNLKGFTSSSADKGIAEEFARQSRAAILIEMRLPKGAQAVDISEHSDLGPREKETLIARNSSFKVLSYSDKTKTLTLEMVMPEASKKQPARAHDAALKTDARNSSGDRGSNRFAWQDSAGIAVSGPDDGEVVMTAASLEGRK